MTETKAYEGARTQLDREPCECGKHVEVTPSDSPWEFGYRCPDCLRRGIISWAHALPPPVFKRKEAGSLRSDPG